MAVAGTSWFRSSQHKGGRQLSRRRSLFLLDSLIIARASLDVGCLHGAINAGCRRGHNEAPQAGLLDGGPVFVSAQTSAMRPVKLICE